MMSSCSSSRPTELAASVTLNVCLINATMSRVHSANANYRASVATCRWPAYRERGLGAGYEFRAGNAAGAPFFNECNATGKVFAIGADQAFRLIVLRRPREQHLFEAHAPYRYHAIASHRRNEDAAATVAWYCSGGDASVSRIKDLKIGFGMEHMPCGTFSANAVFFAIGVLSYKLYCGLRHLPLGQGGQRAQVRTVRWRLFQTASRIVRHDWQVFLKINTAMLDMFTAIREMCASCVREEDALRETS